MYFRSRHGLELGVITRRSEVATTRELEKEMRSQPNIEVATGNLKLSQEKSQLGKSNLQPLCYSRTPREVAT